MTIKSRLNTVVMLSIGTVLVLFGFLFYTTVQISDQLDHIERVNKFSQTASELHTITEQYLAYQEPRYLKIWETLYKRLRETKEKISDFPTRKVVSNSLPSIKKAFSLIRKIHNNPESYQNREKRQRLLERAKARIRSDIQLLQSVSYRLEERKRQSIQDLQVNQRI